MILRQVLFELTEPLPNLSSAKDREAALVMLEDAGWARADYGEGLAEEWHRAGVQWSACLTYEPNDLWATYVACMAEGHGAVAGVNGSGRMAGFDYAFLERLEEEVDVPEAARFCTELMLSDEAVSHGVQPELAAAMTAVANAIRELPGGQSAIAEMYKWLRKRHDGSVVLTEPK